MFPAELALMYMTQEVKLIKMMRKISEIDHEGANNPYLIRQKRELMEMMVALMQLCRASLIHPAIPSARELTIQFSPSRRHLGTKVAKKSCVLCNLMARPTVPFVMKDSDSGTGGGGPPKRRQSNTRFGDADVDDVDEDGEPRRMGVAESEEDLVELPTHICRRTNMAHFAHEDCLAEFEGGECPRCIDLERRLHIVGAESLDFPTHCQHIAALPTAQLLKWFKSVPIDDKVLVPPGFKGSCKLEKLLKWFKSVPIDDKVLVLSYFKGGLDLLEGIFVDEMKVKAKRFDGDVDAETRQRDLTEFKTDPDCRVLLATVAAGGVGLNIVEANHVVFLDRWFNPCVHDQAMDRCYRLGQKKDVEVLFLDCAGTVDEAMLQINESKKVNASIVLAGGIDLGTDGGNLLDQEILVGRLITGIARHRNAFLTQSPQNMNMPIPHIDPARLQELLNEASRRRDDGDEFIQQSDDDDDE
eukprot:CAMPEP_0194067378 /NCGR_PEP_ID=MMETSP0009_2-20130614/86522_1 /TAXON_ID=210454 /ORGANISM="Grammatophora oceanica, Strain CCMP 410" /LENGTH=470 /DNA_ID=CAMNT_0038720397 /DNA_START=102 /DNA_END=1514 /DNA_ORIENTATION=-